MLETIQTMLPRKFLASKSFEDQNTVWRQQSFLKCKHCYCGNLYRYNQIKMEERRRKQLKIQRDILTLLTTDVNGAKNLSLAL